MNGFGMKLKPKSLHDFEYIAQTILDLQALAKRAADRGDTAGANNAASIAADEIRKMKGKPGSFEKVSALLDRKGHHEQAETIRKLATWEP